MGTTQWPEKEEEEKERAAAELFQDPPRLDFSSQSEESPDTSREADGPRESELVPQCTLLPFLSTSPLRFSSSLETPPRTTRRAELFQDTFSSPSETTRNSTSFSAEPPSPPVVFSQTSASSSSQRARTTRELELPCI